VARIISIKTPDLDRSLQETSAGYGFTYLTLHVRMYVYLRAPGKQAGRQASQVVWGLADWLLVNGPLGALAEGLTCSKEG
jgi:hypothetical protein